MSDSSWYRGRSSSVLDAIATTRSIHRFEATEVSKDQLNKILFAATRGPSGSNLQPFRFLVLERGSRATRARELLGAEVRRRWAEKDSREGFRSDGVSDRRSRTANAMEQFVQSFEEIPIVILACLQRNRAPQPLEGASIYPACQNLLLAAADV